MPENDFQFDVVDLTHTLSSHIPGWEGDCGFRMSQVLDYNDCMPPYVFRKHEINTPTGVGTHIDSPSHCAPGGATIEALHLKNLVTDCVVIKMGVATADSVITPAIVEQFEKQYGKISPNTFVIFQTGWEQYWNTPEKYINSHSFPSVSEETAKLLLERDIAGLGIDTLSADTGQHGFPVHRLLLGAGKYLVENIMNAGTLPPTGAKSFALPMKIEGAAEAMIRLVALVPKK